MCNCIAQTGSKKKARPEKATFVNGIMFKVHLVPMFDNHVVVMYDVYLYTYIFLLYVRSTVNTGIYAL
jgi:hypothetical protein